MKDRIVYSTEQGRICPACGQPKNRCACRKQQTRAHSDGIVRISRETKGRKGKGVTLIKGLSLDDAALKKMGKNLKGMCGSGGTVKNGVIEIQGDHIERVMTWLKAQGLTVKRTGG